MLYQAILRSQWEAAQEVIGNDPTVLRASISEGKETALHLAASAKDVHFVEKLVAKMHTEDLEILNAKGNTALCFAAACGNTEIAEIMIKKNDRLPNIYGSDGVKPISLAALLGHRKMVEYLLPLSEVTDWSQEEQAKLLTTCITSGLYDVALKMVQKDSKLIAAKDGNGKTALHVLARTPSAFSGGKQKGMWRRIINFFLCMKEVENGKSQQYHAFKLLTFILDHLCWSEEVEILRLITEVPGLLFVAADLGNTEFLIALINYNPDLTWKVNNYNASIFHVAVLLRHQNIFNLLQEIGFGSLIATRRDDDDNNMLHLAAKLAPQEQLNNVSGAALQMQRELLWYKEVEKTVQPSYRCMENMKGETPQYIFSMEHKDLMKKGEAWMKETAKSCMLVATLIATVVFAAAFTVPGGDSNAGVPLLLHKPFFKVFAISEAIAMFSSSTSILMFLSILTSRYGERDFLHSLPLMLMIGITTLFVSITAMMVAFCSTILLSCRYRPTPAEFLLGVFSCVPVIFIGLKFPLLVDIICSTYISGFQFRSNNRLFQELPR